MHGNLRRRPDRLFDPGDDSVRRHRERLAARGRSRGALHARRDAGKADGDRRRRARRASSTPKARGANARSVQREADFYGAMDGAGKFVKGDAVAALVIVALNLARRASSSASPITGSRRSTRSIRSRCSRSATRSSRRCPAFLISTAMGMMVTRVASDGALGADLAAQLFARPDVVAQRRRRCCSRSRSFRRCRARSSSFSARARSPSRMRRSAIATAAGDRSDRRARARQAQRDAPARARARARRRRRDRDRDRRRSRAAARSAALPTRCSIASARCVARSRPTSASCFPACACATISRAIRGPTAFACAIVWRDRAASTSSVCWPSPTKPSSLRFSTSQSSASRSTGCPRHGSHRRARARGQRRRAGLRSDLGARFAPGRDRAHARARNSSGAKSCRRCSNICARRCRRWSRRSAATRFRSARCTARSRCCCAKARGRAIRLPFSKRCSKPDRDDPRELAEAARRAIVPDLLRRRAVRATRAGDLRARRSSDGSRRRGAGTAPMRLEPGDGAGAARADRTVRRAHAARSRRGRLHCGAAAGARRFLAAIRRSR